MNTDNEVIQRVLSDYETAVSRIVLYCLTELPFSLGIKKTIAVLKGTKSTFAIKHELNKLDTFSVLSSFSRDQLTIVIDAMIQSGLLRIEHLPDYENMPVIKLTETGSRFLQDSTGVHISFLATLVDKEIPELSETEKELFNKLRQLRRDLANEQDIPPFMVCGDQVLREICIRKPTDLGQLLAVKGIGEKFVQKYGDKVVDSVKQTATMDPKPAPNSSNNDVHLSGNRLDE